MYAVNSANVYRMSELGYTVRRDVQGFPDLGIFFNISRGLSGNVSTLKMQMSEHTFLGNTKLC